MSTLTGIVCDGHGAAAHDVHAGIYRPICGPLWPGTLNIRLDQPGPLGPPHRRVWFAGIERRLWPVHVGPWACWMLHADHLGDIVEILAPVHLRSALRLTSGDHITIHREDD